MPQTPGASDLRQAETEAAELASRFGSSEYLSGAAATRAAVTEAMSRHPWAHFACHGIQELHAPSRGRLALYDAPLEIGQLMALRLDNPEFAFLSACETHRGGTKVPDETITLASALQFAGYKHVIATLWPIFDLTSPDVARHVYDKIVVSADGDAAIDASGAAVALRAALTEVIEEMPGIPPLYWAAYIHTGP
jgi:CHAT domain-containing protein